MDHRTEFANTNTFEYSFPNDAEDNVDSTKSTPYYTPLEFCQSSFEFPSPKPVEKPVFLTPQIKEDSTLETSNNYSDENMDFVRTPSSPTVRQFAQAGAKQLQTTSSPAVSRKLRRFSLYERRSCSPQHLLTKNIVGSVDLEASSPVDDKENAKPPQFFDQISDENFQNLTKSGNNSPAVIKDECGSPKILTTDGVARHNFSPKLLASINNLKLANSPFGIISSAGYKNGNYFKFPEIDNVVQEHTAGLDTAPEAASPKCDNQARNVLKQGSTVVTPNKPQFISTSLDSDHATKVLLTKEGFQKETEVRNLLVSKNESGRKNRKNKNNLTIQITDSPASTELALHMPVQSSSPTVSPSSKPKTPTIKTTKEKALSLDSAPCETGLSIIIQSGESQTHVSCDEIDSKTHFISGVSPGSSQLRQRNIISRDRLRPSISSTSSKQSVCSSASSPAVYRSGHKPSPLLHTSNTNLKTLPEFLTLVEFSTSSPKERDHCPFKQKSMDLPSTSSAANKPNSVPTSATATTPVFRSKNAASSAVSLLQRRGSNHSLTLNLHGSCSNLVGSCRSGLSVSNYSLGSAANSITNLNLKSGCNLDVNKGQIPRQASESGTNSLQPSMQLSSQGAKQSLFRRRGSNQSLTLRHSTATSCGNLNSFSSQTALNVERTHLHIPRVPRTTSFITPSQHIGSNVPTPKRGLLERRGSNQSLTLNMSSSFGGIGADRNAFLVEDFFQRQADNSEMTKVLLPPCCAQHHRKFFSSENLNKANTQSDSNEENRHSANRPFGSASDLKASGLTTTSPTQKADGQHDVFFNNEDSSVCTCGGMRNIMTRPLSPQRKAEEFKTYLANIQTLQNASNILKQADLIKLNYIFDNSYTSNNKSLQEVLPIVLGVEPSSAGSGKESLTPSGTASTALVTTSEDFEIAIRYEEAVKSVLDSLRIDIEKQKRIFCDLHKEFWDLPLNHQEKPLVFGSQTKNRYKTILPNENTRFMLQKETTQMKKSNLRPMEAAVSTASTSTTIDPEEKISSSGTGGNKLLIASADTPYINANFIKGPDVTSFCYVATQGPLPNTIFEFWLMVYQNVQNQKLETIEYPFLKEGTPCTQYYQKIVMLTNFLEHHRQKCAVYFPVELNEIFIATSKQEVISNNEALAGFFDEYLQTSSATVFCGEDGIENFQVQELSEEICESLPQTGNCFVIKNIGIVRKHGFSIRKMVVLYCMLKQRENSTDEKPPELFLQRFFCYHYWYPDWPDHRSPRDINTLLDICLHILNLGKCEAEFDSCGQSQFAHITAQKIELYQQDIFNALQPLPIIHCSAGVGRTGCLTAVLNGIRQMRQSLSYSLTSMAAAAAAASNKTSAKVGQPLSPIDFRLPSEFFFGLNQDELSEEFGNDTDSSFTRNTLLYIRYIVEKQKKNTETAKHENQEAIKDSFSDSALSKISKLTDLPKMPDIIVDILGIVCNLRLSRGGMVQNSEQYELIHRALGLYLKRTFALKRF